MATVERLLSAGLVEFQSEDPTGPAATFCLQSYFTELTTRFDNGFDPSLGHAGDVTVFDPATVAPGPVRRVRDFPAGSERLTADAPAGMRHVVVNGRPIQVDGSFLEGSLTSRPGQLVRPAPRG